MTSSISIYESGFARWDFPGDFEHSFVYKGQLFALDHGGVLRYASLADAARLSFPSNPLSSANRLLGALLLDNRLLDDAELQEVAALERSAGRDIGQWRRELEANIWQHAADLGPALGGFQVLDITVYYDRIYLSTTGGVFHLDFTVAENHPVVGLPVRRSDAYSLSSTVKYGCVAVSCGEDGLFVGLDEFNKRDQMRVELGHVGGESWRSSWFKESLLSYESSGGVRAFTGEIADTVVDGAHNPMRLLTTLTAASDEKRQELGLDYLGTKDDSIDITFNVESNCLRVRSDGWAEFTERLQRKGKYQSRVFFEGAARVGRSYDAFAIVARDDNFDDARIGIHSRQGVFLMNRRNILKVADPPVASVKSFPSSRRYQNLAAITAEDRVSLCSPIPHAWGVETL